MKLKKIRKTTSQQQPVVDHPTKPGDNALVSMNESYLGWNDFVQSVNGLLKISFPAEMASASSASIQTQSLGITFEELGLIVAHMKNQFFPFATWEDFMDTVAFPEKHLPELEKYFYQPKEAEEEKNDESTSSLTMLSWEEFMNIIAFPEKFFLTTEQTQVNEDLPKKKGKTRMKIMKKFFKKRRSLTTSEEEEKSGN